MFAVLRKRTVVPVATRLTVGAKLRVHADDGGAIALHVGAAVRPRVATTAGPDEGRGRDHCQREHREGG